MTADETIELPLETAPLLKPNRDRNANGRDASAGGLTAKSPAAVISIVSFMIFCLTLSGTLSIIPLGRLVEDAVCRRYYGDPGPIDEKRCKVDEVQAELAWMGGLYIVIAAVVGMSSSHHLSYVRHDNCLHI